MHALVLAGAITLLSTAALPPVARAEEWIKVGTDKDLGFDICLDRDSIHRDAKGLIYYRTQICQRMLKERPNPISETAVDCSQDMAARIGKMIKLRRLKKAKWESKEIFSNSLDADAARHVCRK